MGMAMPAIGDEVVDSFRGTQDADVERTDGGEGGHAQAR